MKKTLLIGFSLALIIFSAFKTEDKLINTNGHINFYSHTAVEDITADNYKVTSTLNKSTGEVVYSVPMQSFEFEKALMQKHYNSKNFLDTKNFPKAKFKGKIDNLSAVNFDQVGTYKVNVSGDLTIKGITNAVTETGTIKVSTAGIESNSKMQITLADYGIEFSKGDPSTNIAKTIDVTTVVVYK